MGFSRVMDPIEIMDEFFYLLSRYVSYISGFLSQNQVSEQIKEIRNLYLPSYLMKTLPWVVTGNGGGGYTSGVPTPFSVQPLSIMPHC